MNLSENENKIVIYALIALTVFSLMMYGFSRYKLKKEISKKEALIYKQKSILDKADQVVFFLKQKVAEDSIIITSYERRINILYQELNAQKEKTKGYEYLINKKPTNPVRIISVDEAELFLSRRYFPAKSEGKRNGK